LRFWPVIILIALISTACSTPEPVSPPTEAPIETVQEEALSTEPLPTPEPEAEVLDLGDLPIVPEISERAVEVYRAGVQSGRNPAVFTKVGDCMTDNEQYLYPIADGSYDLAEYSYLSTVIDTYSGVPIRDVEGAAVDSFSNPSLSVACGFNSASPLDPIWADPNFCNQGEPPLACELRVSNASVVLIMLGTHDVYFETDKFRGYLDDIVQTSLDANTLPVLITFPTRTDEIEQTKIYNGVIVDVAQSYDIPVPNLWLALQDLEDYGIAPGEVTELSTPEDGCGTCFTEANLQSGIVVQNLVALEALNAIIQAVEE